MPEVSVDLLRPTCNADAYGFTNTSEVEPFDGLIGQDRAVKAIQFGLAMQSRGYNICITGEQGTGRTSAATLYVQEFARGLPVPDDWCYVHNFRDAYRPRALRLPAGRAAEFARNMAMMVSEAKDRIPRTYESDDFQSRRQEIMGSVQRHRDAAFMQLAQQAQASGFLLQGNPQGFFLVPLANGHPMDDAAFSALPPEERRTILERREALMEQLRDVLKQGAGFEQAAGERLADLEKTVATMVVSSLLDSLFDAYRDFAGVVEYLSDVRADMIANISQFQPVPEQPGPQMPFQQNQRELGLRKYFVNVVVDNSGATSPAVVQENNPIPGHLLGRIEKEAVFGALTTDFTMIRPGSLHRTIGGFLLFNFDDLLVNPISYVGLKRTLRSGTVTIEEMGDRLGYIDTRTVRPEPIPWTGKVIGMAREEVYRTLYAADPEFRELFKVKADFDLHIDRTPEHEQAYARLIAGIIQKESLMPLDAYAVGRVVEEGMRMVEDHYKLSMRFGELMDVVREAGYWAAQEGRSVAGIADVSKAIYEKTYRVNLIEAHLREAVSRGIMVVETAGEQVGQINGLTVISIGDLTFGQPSRITASIGVGREGLIDLQREARMAGPIHTKAVLTLQGFLIDRYATRMPLALHARLAFEQSYGPIEGDSATVAETCALLSELAEAPIKQSLAITGSMDQRGDVQAIGGVNYKIEGFFDTCRLRGLSGDQGVIIPASNVQHLVLREDVVEAVRQGTFNVYAVSTIDEAIELLMDAPAGERDASGAYPEDSINGRVVRRLTEIGESLRHSQSPPAQAPAPASPEDSEEQEGQPQ